MTNRSETSARSPGARLQAAYLSEPLAIPGVFNALVARMAEHAGFDAIYLSGAAVSAGVTALPDVGLLSLDEITRQVRLIVATTNVPLIVDADTGFGGALHVEQAIRQIEASGAAGVQLEDQELPKRCGHLTGKHLIPAGDMVQKLRAATAARVSTYPALGMYRWVPAVGLSDIFLSSSKNRSGGSTTGLPSDRSKTFSSPCCCLRAMPSSNILRIQEPRSMRVLIFFETAMMRTLTGRQDGVKPIRIGFRI